MAEQGETESVSDTGKFRSKIPRYVRPKIPVCSLEYKNVLRSVSDKRTKIFEIQGEIKKMKETLNDQRACFGLGAHGDDRSPELTAQPMPASSETTRKVILTPGGTKRKVKPCYLKFKADLKLALEHLIYKKTESVVMVDDLVSNLQKRFQGVQGFESFDRVNILGAVSKIYGKKVEYMGKKKRAYYRGFAFIENPDLENSGQSTDSSEHDRKRPSKARKGLLLDSYVETDSSIKDTTTTESDYFMRLDELAFETQHLEEAIMSKSEEESKNDPSKMLFDFKKSFSDYDNHVQKIIKKQDEVISLQEDIVSSGMLLGGLLSLSERNAITSEVEKAKKLFNFGIRDNKTSDISGVFDPLLFQKLVTNFKLTCPTITNILEQLVISHNTSRNILKTENLKMKAAVHLLASLLDIRDQHGKNDIPILFGLLCICYGAGPAMIRVLQRLGLSESFPVLVNVLRSQLMNYKDVITQRLCSTLPVITYQDNMQISRTSLRHLRLSKLQKEKVKQGKMWDFTVRGWREADITGIEEYFNEEQAVNPQQQVKSIVYEDTKIESHDELNSKWITYKNRNLLRKMDLALNTIFEPEDDIKSATSEVLQKIADNTEDRQIQAMFWLGLLGFMNGSLNFS